MVEVENMPTRMSIHVMAFAVLLLIARPPNVSAAEPGPDYTAIDAYVQSQVETNHFAGVAIAVVEGASLSHAQGIGHDAQGRPVTPRTPFMIGSNSKSFTALAVMQLVDAGLVDLDAPVQQYVPQFRVADPVA